MNERPVRHRLIDAPFAWFFLGALTIIGACAAVVRTAAFAQNPELGYFGVTFDLCISIPLLYYFLVVRRGHARQLSAVPIFIACLLIARAVVPGTNQQFLNQLAWLQVPLAAASVIVIAVKVRAATLASRGEHDPVTKIELICRKVIGDSRGARIVSTELSALYLGLLGWRLPEAKHGGGVSTTFHKRAGWGSVVTCILVLIAAEAVAVHLFIQQWSPTVAWFVTALDVWGAIWLLGDYHAFRIRPLTVTEEAVELRFGFRWSATIPRSIISSVEALSPEDAEARRHSRDYLRLSLLDEPRYLIKLREAVLIRGAAGLARNVISIGIGPDDVAIVAELQKVKAA